MIEGLGPTAAPGQGTSGPCPDSSLCQVEHSAECQMPRCVEQGKSAATSTFRKPEYALANDIVLNFIGACRNRAAPRC
jgi:hypothetical protein